MRCQPPIRFSHRSIPRSGGIHRSRTSCRPHHFPRLRGTKGCCGGGSGEPSGCPSGEPAGRSPLGSARTVQSSSATLCAKRERPNRHGSPAGSPLGSARTVQSSSATLCAKRERPNRHGSPAGRFGKRSARGAPTPARAQELSCRSAGVHSTTVVLRSVWLLEAAHAVGLKPAACRAKAAAAAWMRRCRPASQRVARGFSRRAGGRTPTVVIEAITVANVIRAARSLLA
jgi:hypothetical protein